MRADAAEVVAAKRLSSPRYRLKLPCGSYLVRGAAGLEIDSVLVTELFGVECTDGGEVQVVEVRNRHAIEREIELQNTEWFDPKTRVRPNFIKPDTFITGHGSASGGIVTIDLEMRGKVTGSASVTMPVSQLLEAASAVAADIKGQIGGRRGARAARAPITGARLG